MTGRPRPDARIWLQTGFVLAVYTGFILVVYLRWLEAVRPVALGLVVALVAVQLVAIVALLTGLISRKVIVAARERATVRTLPIVRDRLIRHLLGEDQRHVLSGFMKGSPRAVKRCVVELLGSLSGAEHFRLSELAMELGIVEQWQRQARSRSTNRRWQAVGWISQLADWFGNGALRAALDDPRTMVRIEAARGLLRSEAIGDIEAIFDFATTQPLLARAILVDDLRNHALQLSEQALPRALASTRTSRVELALEMIEAWQKGLWLPAVAPLLRHPRPGIRSRALRALPYVAGGMDAATEISAALDDDDPTVREAACTSAGRLAVVEAVPRLVERLETDISRVALAAAYALGELGQEGSDALEARVSASRPLTRSAALEVLERVKTSRLHLARV